MKENPKQSGSCNQTQVAFFLNDGQERKRNKDILYKVTHNNSFNTW